jgi:hypothetical protein
MKRGVATTGAGGSHGEEKKRLLCWRSLVLDFWRETDLIDTAYKMTI